MEPLPEKLYTAAQVREMDRCLIEDKGIAGFTLMCRAGDTIFKLISQRWPNVNKILIYAGAGNNGGDGYVVARLAHDQGLQVQLVQMGDIDKIKGDAEQARSEYLHGGGSEISVNSQSDCPGDYGLIIDAIFGTGLHREVTDKYRQTIEAINNSDVPVLCADIPSGLNSDTGKCMGVAVKAAVTVTFIGLKQGMFTADGPDYSGDIVFDGLAGSSQCYHEVESSIETSIGPSVDRILLNYIKLLLPARRRSCYKNQCGHVLIVGGGRGMPGAVRLAGEAALRSGAGLVTIATHPEHANLIAASRPELMCFPIADASELLSLLDKVDLVAIGPGMGSDAWALSLFKTIMQIEKPLVVDADALNLLAKHQQTHRHWVLTPHPGEAARLLECDTATIQQDRFASVVKLAEAYNATVVLKGVGTLISAGSNKQGRVSLCDAGNPGMATAGMGDVLTGVIAALIAQGLNLDQAANAGVWIHANAADKAAGDKQRGLIASDVISCLRPTVNFS